MGTKPVHFHIDFETQSERDLRVFGAYDYAQHSTTRVLCIGFALGDKDVRVVTPKVFKAKVLPKLIPLLKSGKVLMVAHNANFEINIWNKCLARKEYGFPKLPYRFWDCTMVRAYAMGLPGGLDDAAAAAGLNYRKDMKGHRVMMQLCKPRGELDGKAVFYDEVSAPEKFKALFEYCARDVEVERELDKRLRPLSTSEKKLWIVDQKINERGFGVDVEAAIVAGSIVSAEKLRLDELMCEVTDRYVTTCTANAALLRWIRLNRIKVDSVDADTIKKILAHPKVPKHVKKVCKIRQLAAKTSTAKLKRMVAMAALDGMARGSLQFLGAQSTGRWAARHIQPQNMPRQKLSQDTIEEIFEIFHRAERKSRDPILAKLSAIREYGSVMDVISQCLRGFIIPSDPGHEFVGGDYSQIEARLTAWFAGQQDKLDVFRNNGDIYIEAAAGIYGIAQDKVTDDQRQVGKASELAFGFGGGLGAFRRLGANIEATDDEVQGIKYRWRKDNPFIVSLWYSLQDAAIWAVKNPGRWVTVGRVSYCCSGSFLRCKLPSGREICDPYPKIEIKPDHKGRPRETLTAKWSNSQTKKWERRDLWYGILIENIVQATARDILAHAILNLESHNYPVHLHVHDEVLTETPKGWGDQVKILMEDVPQWCDGLPVAAKTWRGIRYQKD